MEFRLREGEEFIKLGQLLKAANLVSSGIEAKVVIQNGEVKVNGEVDERRGKKIVAGDTVEYNNNVVNVK
ncbi:MAG: RNA-binding S4 domain-containing protein [Eubacterium sp.]|nr:RNA-binding S4 domain-containing protein [Eubacterium sp.]MBR1675198.1 RNA-binding S4 domain-containing protein [Eubacterium sp.]